MASRRLFAEELVVRLDAILFASPSHRALNRAAVLLEPLSRGQQDLVLQWARVAAITDAELAHQVCAAAARVFELTDEAGFVAWLKRGLADFDAHGPAVARQRLDDVEGFVAEYSGCAGVVFVDVEPQIARFLFALGGHELQIKASHVAWTDTESVYLPARIETMMGPGANWQLYKAIAVLLWAQIRYGTFTLDIEAQVSLWDDPAQGLHWLAALEAVRHENLLAHELPGLAAEIAAIRGPWPDDLKQAASLLDTNSTVADSLRILDGLRLSSRPPPKLPHLGVLDPAAVIKVRLEKIQQPMRVERVASNTLRGLGGVGQGDDSFAPLATDLAADDGNVAGGVSDDHESTPKAADAPQSELRSGNAQSAGEGVWQPVSADAGTEPTVAAQLAKPDHLYDEWDYHRQAYRRQWCRLYAHDGEPGEANYVREIRRRHAPQIRRIRRRFEALRGEDEILRHQPDGDEVDLDSFVDALADLRLGAELTPRLFCRRQRTERSLAVMFMVDMSGSTKGWVNDAEREALVMLCEAFEALDDRYAIYGFSGWTRTQCDIYRIKTFDDSYDDSVRARISGIEAKDYTRMGVAIRHLSKLLNAENARHKLLVILSDGRPDDFGDEYRGHYGIEDTRRALQEARYAGIRPYCVTIDRHGADYLKRLYGEASYSVLADVTKLPLRLAEVYRRLTS
ncbi:MAG: VWA domain-containing protein [Rhodocyclaceae bacterium]|nr:VWA domain-containing protein [Rhodocyclaceae bacterium]MBP7080835.1 VWA domain-containing protein [Rhodocyclaceae bacterium]